MNTSNQSRVAQSGVLTINKTLKSTYQLLAATLVFSGVAAMFSMAMNLPSFGWFTLIGYFALLFLTSKMQNSAWGIVCVFALTGFMGLSLGPFINAYVGAFSNGSQLVAMAMTATGLIFFSLSFYAIYSQKDFSFLGGFLMVGILTAFLAGLAAYFFSMPILSLVVSAAFVLLMSALILYETSQIIHGGQTNYIMATVTLYISIYNLFISLLQLLGVFSGED